jgi:hypothetical protein
MPDERVSSRGDFLNWRLAVKGIQNASSSGFMAESSGSGTADAVDSMLEQPQLEV